MKKASFYFISHIILLFTLCSYTQLFASSSLESGKINPVAIKTIMDTLEKKYAVEGFSADFFQESPLPDLGISESAEGNAFFKKPEKFRWEYTMPDVLHYISDGNTLWIHSKEDNNVWIGKTAAFFGKGSSVTFLTDIKSIRTKFKTGLLNSSEKNLWKVELTPSGTTSFGINKIYLFINKKSSIITKIITYNLNNEETRITLSNYNFKKIPSDGLFSFEIPEKANIIPLD